MFHQLAGFATALVSSWVLLSSCDNRNPMSRELEFSKLARDKNKKQKIKTIATRIRSENESQASLLKRDSSAAAARRLEIKTIESRILKQKTKAVKGREETEIKSWSQIAILLPLILMALRSRLLKCWMGDAMATNNAATYGW